MTRAVVEYENLLAKTFSDQNTARPNSGAVPRWKRKQIQSINSVRKKGIHSSSGKFHPESRNIKDLNLKSSSDSSGEFCKPLGILNGRLRSNITGGDRFIPNRAAMDLEKSSHSIRVTESSCDLQGKSRNDDGQILGTANRNEEYKSILSSEILGIDDSHWKVCAPQHRILSFKEKAPLPKCDTVNNLNILYSSSGTLFKSSKVAKLVSRQIPSAPSRVLDAPDLLDDYYLNLLSWSDTNILAVALAQTVYLWNASTGTVQELCTQNDDSSSYISSLSWVQEGGIHLAVGTSTGRAQLWDVNESKQLRSMDGHTERIGALSWNRHILSTGGRDSIVVNHDVRIASHNVATLSNHSQEICGLAWSHDGTMLASGGNDNVLSMWDGVASSVPRYTCTDHQAAVKALAWSPHERNLLATGGGTADRCIKFWSGNTGALLNSIDTGSQVCALQWNSHEREILSSHGFAKNQLCLWKYPSMVKIKELEGHTARVLHMASSPDGCTVVSAAADETLRFWDIFATTGIKVGKRTIGDSVRLKGKKLSKTMHIR